LPISRSLIAVACVAGLLTLPSVAAAQGGKTALSHVIKTPKGSQLAVPITVRYRLDGKGKSLERSVLVTRLSIAARLPGGRLYRATEYQTVPGQARVKLEHHAFFSVRQTRVLRKALAAKQRIKVTVTSSLRADLDGDGRTDARASQRTVQVLARPSRPRSGKPSPALRGEDPCGALRLSTAVCTNVTGTVFTARHLWDVTNGLSIPCPSAFPVATETVRVRTRSSRFTATVWSRNARAQVQVTDLNAGGHPVTYAPVVACTVRPG
jgi:hypothetical protein